MLLGLTATDYLQQFETRQFFVTCTGHSNWDSIVVEFGPSVCQLRDTRTCYFIEVEQEVHGIVTLADMAYLE